MSYNPHVAPAAALGSGSAASLSPGSLHPVGMLYTLLRHGHGLSHEEAARRCASLAASATLSA